MWLSPPHSVIIEPTTLRQTYQETGGRLLNGIRQRRPSGLYGALERPRGRTPLGSIWVRMSIMHQYETVERSIETWRVPLCQIRVLTKARRNPIWPERIRPVLTDTSRKVDTKSFVVDKKSPMIAKLSLPQTVPKAVAKLTPSSQPAASGHNGSGGLPKPAPN